MPKRLSAACIVVLFGAAGCAQFNGTPSPKQGHLELGAKDGGIENHFCQPLHEGEDRLGVLDTVGNTTDHPIEIVSVKLLDPKNIADSHLAAAVIPDGQTTIYGWTSQAAQEDAQIKTVADSVKDQPLTLQPGQQAAVGASLTPTSGAADVDVRQIEVLFKDDPSKDTLSSARGSITYEFRSQGCAPEDE